MKRAKQLRKVAAQIERAAVAAAKIEALLPNGAMVDNMLSTIAFDLTEAARALEAQKQ